MISASDKEYIDTKQIMLGSKSMNPDFKALSIWIDKTFSVKTINIIYDLLSNHKDPRINICFENYQEKESFNEKDGFNYDYQKQKLIAKKFKETLLSEGIVKQKGLFNFFEKQKYLVDQVFVCFSAFKPIAQEEAVRNIPENRIKNLKEQLNNPDLWNISRGFSATTFFLYTDEQVKKYENSNTLKDWKNKYFEILKEYDEFNYFSIEDFSIYLDSKENFDNNYESNWYYYYK